MNLLEQRVSKCYKRTRPCWSVKSQLVYYVGGTKTSGIVISDNVMIKTNTRIRQL
ncbi:MAG: hypothetical protein ACLU2J_06525 [Clostridia bacterium]